MFCKEIAQPKLDSLFTHLLLSTVEVICGFLTQATVYKEFAVRVEEYDASASVHLLLEAVARTPHKEVLVQRFSNTVAHKKNY